MVAIHLLTLVGFTRIAELFPVLAPLHLGKLAFALGGVALALALGRRSPGDNLLEVPLLKPVLLLLVCAGLSIPLSVWHTGALAGFVGFSKTVFIFVVLSILGARAGTETLRLGLLGGVVLLAGLMFADKATGRAAVSATYDANDIAVLFAMFLPVLFAEGVARRGVWRAAAWAGACTTLLGIAMTQSRGVLIALAAVALQAVLSSRRRLVLLLVLGLAAGVFVLSADDAYWDRLATVGDAESDYNVAAKSGRIELWKSGVVMLLRNPLTGVGVGQFAAANFMIGNGVYLTAHNTYIQVMTEMGLPALVVFIALLRGIIVFIREGRDSVALSEADRIRWSGVRYGLTAFMVGVCFISSGYSTAFFSFLALVSVMRARQLTLEAALRDAPEPEAQPVPTEVRKGGEPRRGPRRGSHRETRREGRMPQTAPPALATALAEGGAQTPSTGRGRGTR